MKDLMFILPYQAGTLSQLTAALSEAGVNLQGVSGQQFGPEGIIHVLVENAPEAREAAARAGFVVRGEQEVIVADIEDRPGALAELVRRQMRGVYELRVPLEVSMATGRSWAEAQH